VKPRGEITLRAWFDRLQTSSLIVGAIGMALCGLGWFLQPRQFFFSYLFGYLLWMGLALGCSGVAMIHHLTGGAWGFIIRRFLEAGMATMPLMAALSLPIFFGLGHLYSWANPTAVAHDEMLHHKQLYLNTPAFAVRMFVFFGFWITLAWLLNRWSAAQDRSVNPEPTRRLRKLSGPGLVLYALIGTLAVVDWIMVLENDWYSSIFPVQVIIGQMLSTLAFCVALLGRLRHYEPWGGRVQTGHFHALGNLLLTFVMLWAYMSVSQLIIIWSGNLPREISWYLHRVAGGWKWVAIFLALFHFAVPFCILLAREAKRRVEILMAVAIGVLCAHAVEVFWMIAPSLHMRGVYLSWLDIAAPAGIGGLWLAQFFSHLKRRPLLPVHDPRLEPILAQAYGKLS
jgi:hypothetical protein